MPGYVKLFNSLLQSSRWCNSDSETKVVLITLMLLTNRDGVVDATIPGIAKEAGVSEPKVEEALSYFAAPDKRSRSKLSDGRTIEETDDGFWRFVNYDKYRFLQSKDDLAEKNRLRQQRWREAVRAEEIAYPPDYVEKIERQGTCACCGKPFEKPYRLYVVADRDHTTKQQRGLICQSCNKIVGQIENGKKTVSQKADLCRAYINRHASSRVVTPVTRRHDISRKQIAERDSGIGDSNSIDISNILPRDTYCAARLENSALAPVVISLPLNDGSEFPIYENQITEWQKLFPAVDVGQQLRNIRAWDLAHRERRKTKRGINAHIVTWLSKEQDSAARNGDRTQRRQTPGEQFLEALRDSRRKSDVG